MQPILKKDPVSAKRRFRSRHGLVLAIAVALFVSASYFLRPQPRVNPMPSLSRRVAAMCKAMTGSSESVTIPYLIDETVQLRNGVHGTRQLWCVTGQAEGRRIILLFNGKTGKVCCAFGETRAATDIHPANMTPITTPEEAERVAILRLQQLEMVAPDAEYALISRPKKVREGSAWQIEWKVKHAGNKKLRYLKIVLDSVGGFPLHVNDQYEMQQFVE